MTTHQHQQRRNKRNLSVGELMLYTMKAKGYRNPKKTIYQPYPDTYLEFQLIIKSSVYIPTFLNN